jgi:hypothetical protein
VTAVGDFTAGLLLATLETIATGRERPHGAIRLFQALPHSTDDQFQYFVAADGDFPEFMPCLPLEIGSLAQVAADVAADYFAYYAHGSALEIDDMLRRMRADLHATASKIPLLDSVTHRIANGN